MTGIAEDTAMTGLSERLRQDAEMLRDGWQENLTELWHSETVKDAAKDCAEAAAEIDSQRARLADYEEWAADVKRLTRKLDVEMHGDGAAKQASLCDLIGSAKALRARLEEAEKNCRGLRVAMSEHTWEGIDAAYDRADAAEAEVAFLTARVRELEKALMYVKKITPSDVLDYHTCGIGSPRLGEIVRAALKEGSVG